MNSSHTNELELLADKAFSVGSGYSAITTEVESIVKARIESRYVCPYKTTDFQRRLINAVFEDQVTFKPTLESHDHVVLKFIDDLLFKELTQNLRTATAVTLVGTTLKEHWHLTKELMQAEVYGIYGDIDAKDKARQNDNHHYSQVIRKLQDERAKFFSLQYKSFAEKRPNNYMSWSTAPNFSRSDYLIAHNSLYDISPMQLFKMMILTGCSTTLATMIITPEILQYERHINYVLQIEWFNDGRYVHMRHTNGVGLGYCHSLSNYMTWVTRSIHYVGHKMLLVEPVKTYCGYTLLKIDLVDQMPFRTIRSFVLSDTHRLIIDVWKWHRHRREVFYIVDFLKLVKLIDYVARLTNENTDPARILTYLSAMRNRLVVGAREIEHEMQMDEISLKHMINFAIFYGILRKSEVFRSVGKAISIARNQSKYPMKLKAFFTEVIDTITLKDKRNWMKKLESCLNPVKNWTLEHYDVHSQLPHIKLFAKVDACEPETYILPKDVSVPKQSKLCVDLELDKPRYPRRRRPKTCTIVLQPPTKETVTIIEPTVEPEDYIAKIADFEEIQTTLLSLKQSMLDNWVNGGYYQTIFEKNRGYAKAKFFLPIIADSRVLDIGYFPGGSTYAFEEAGLEVAALGPNEFTGKPTMKAFHTPRILLEGCTDQWLNSPDDLAGFRNAFWFSDASVDEGDSELNADLHQEILDQWLISPSNDLVIKIFQFTPGLFDSISKLYFKLFKPYVSKTNLEWYLHVSKTAKPEDPLPEFRQQVSMRKRLLYSTDTFINLYEKLDLDKQFGSVHKWVFEWYLGNFALPDVEKDKFYYDNILGGVGCQSNSIIVNIGGSKSESEFKHYTVIDPKINYKLREATPMVADFLILFQTFHHMEDEDLKVLTEILRLNDNLKIIFKDHAVDSKEKKLLLRLLHKLYKDETDTNYMNKEGIFEYFAHCGYYPSAIVDKNFYSFECVFSKVSQKGKFLLEQSECESIFQSIKNHYFAEANGEHYTNYTDMLREISDGLKSVVPLRSYSNIDIEAVRKPAGGGKTFEMMRDMRHDGADFYVCPSTALLAEFREKWVKNKHPPKDIPARTFDAFTRDIVKKKIKFVDTLWLDEAFVFPITYLICLMTLLPKMKIRLYGDPRQTQHMDGEYKIPDHYQLSQFLKYIPNLRIDKYTYRYGGSLCKYLRDEFGYDVWCVTDTKFVCTVSDLEHKIKAELDLCYSKKTQKWLEQYGIKALTVRAAQGKDVKTVNLYMSQADDFAAKVESLQIVSLTRASDWLNIVELDSSVKMAEKILPHIYKLAILTEAQTDMIPIIPNFHEVAHNKMVLSNVPCDTDFDPVTLIATFTNALPENIQQSVAVVVPDVKKRVLINTAAHYEKIDRTDYKVTATGTNFGKDMRVASHHQTLATALTRMEKAALASNYVVEPKDYEDILLWLKNYKAMFFVDKIVTSFDEVLTSFHRNCQDTCKKYLHLAPGLLPTIESVGGFARSFLKQETRPKGLIKADSDATGQDIKAWAKEINLALSGFFKTATEILLKWLDKKWIYANGLSEVELADRIKALGKYEYTIDSDATSMDSCHNLKTIELEKYFWVALLGGNFEEGVKLYALMRSKIKVISDCFSYTKGPDLDSGSVATLAANVIFNMFAQMLVMDLSDCLGGPWKGDDSSLLFRGPKPLINVEAVKKLANMELKIETNEVVFFCNSYYSMGFAFYSLDLLIMKILQRNYVGSNLKVSQGNFADYKQSVLVLLTPYLEHPEVVQLYSAYRRKPVEQVLLQISIIRAFIDLTWEKLTKILNKFEITDL